MDAKEKVERNLKKFNITNDVSKIMKHLVKIQGSLEKCTTELNKSVELLSNGTISVNRISKEAKISRQTFYNNPDLINYIEKYKEAYLKENPYDKIDELKGRINRQEEMIDKMVQRDATIEEYKMSKQKLEEKVRSLEKTIETQQKRIEELTSTNEKIYKTYN